MVARTLLPLLLLSTLLGSASAGPAERSVWGSYVELYDSLLAMQPDPTRCSRISGVQIQRDAGVFTLTNGVLALCTPVGGRTIAAVFNGTGTFHFVPATAVEREQLARFVESDTVHTEFESLVLLFTDTTASQITRILSQPSPPSDDAHRALKNALKYFIDKDRQEVDPDLMRPLLDKAQTIDFIAVFGDQPLCFRINSHDDEEVSFLLPIATHLVHRFETVVRTHLASEYAYGIFAAPETREDMIPLAYTINADIDDGLDFSASARVTVQPRRSDQQWLQWYLYGKLDVDSVLWSTGEKAEFFRGEESSLLWVRSEPLTEHQPLTMTVWYHGDLLYRGEFGWIELRSPDFWYPRVPESRRGATYDITFRHPDNFTLVSITNRMAERKEGDRVVSRWVSPGPMRNASFNIGVYKEFVFEDPRIPKVTVYMAEGGHSEIGGALASQGVLSGRHMEKQVGADVVNSLSFFQTVYGRIPANELFATEIPENHGEAFPGMIHLGWSTFQVTDLSGEDEIFRAHEVAHQWWGIGVDFRTYHDQWLSEGFSDFSGLWYMQTVLKDTKKYFDVLREWKKLILDNRSYLFGKGQEAGPVWLGWRTQSSATSGDYDLIIYKKGAWVLHMLRVLLTDLKTLNDDAFTSMMKDFYATWNGKQASTDDFRAVVEKHTGMDMRWFFDQWIMGTKTPEYTVSHHTVPLPNGKFKVTLRVKQSGVPRDFKAYVPLLVTFGSDRFARLRIEVSGNTEEIDLPLMPLAPEEIIFNDLEGVLGTVAYASWD